ncbi:MAG: FlgD immunoglobulin-like domain containing protein [Candidatus Eiseniibacteriota bacterium]
MRTPGLALAAALTFVVPAVAQPIIDDFETGTIHLASPGGGVASGAASVSSPGHAIASFRNVQVLSKVAGGLPTRADLDAWTVVDDALRITIPPGGGDAWLWWLPASPVDLTEGGLNDRIEIAFSAVTVGASLFFQIYDAVGGSYVSSALPLSAGANVIRFADLTQALTVDPTQVIRFQIIVSHDIASMFDLRDIRAMRDESIWQKLEIIAESAVGPPYPLEALPFLMTDEVPSDVQAVRLLGAAKITSGADAGLAVTGADSGGDTAAGFAGALTFEWDESGMPYESTAFDLEVGISAVSGVEPHPFLSSLPAVTSTPTGFLLQDDVEFRDAGGSSVRTSRRQMHVDALPGQALAFGGVRVHALAPARAAGSGFRVTFDAAGAGGVDSAEPLFEATFTGDCRPAGSTGLPETANAGTVRTNELVAWPSVTRGGTEFRLAGPANAELRIELFDVAGRLVRRLPVHPGDITRTWDGRGSDGRVVAAGVYFATLSGAPAGSAARVVRIP